jgi:hypothetical protein
MMKSASANWLALCGIGVAVTTFCAPQLGIALPHVVLISLLAMGCLMTLGGFVLAFAAGRSGKDPEIPDSRAYAAHSGAGSVSGNVISNSTVHVGAISDSNAQSGDQFRRALANVEVELERAHSQIQDAIKSHRYRRRFPIHGSPHHHALSNLLADRDLSDERRQLSQTYRQFERLNNRMRERKWSGGAIPEMTTPGVRAEDRLGEVNQTIEGTLDTLDRLRASLQVDAPSRSQTWEELSRRYATWEELSESGKTWGDLADARVSLHDDIGAEIVAMIDEIRTDAFTETRYATYIDWVDRNSAFIETVLGPVEREQFRGQAGAPTIDATVDLHIERLRDLLHRLPDLPLRVEAGRLQHAIQQRGESSRPAFVTMRQ